MTEAISYTLALTVLSGVVTSYAIAYFRKSTIHVLALLLFFCVTWFSSLIIVVKLWANVFEVSNHIPGASIRGIMMLAVSWFLLYTTWKKNDLPE